MTEFRLRPWKPDDAASLAQAANNPKIAQNLRNAFPSPYTLKDAEYFIHDCISNSGGKQLMYAIEADGKAVGGISVLVKEDVYEKSAELGYWLSEDYWRRGIMSRAVPMICREAFAAFDIVRIFAEPFAHNAGSRGVLEKAGIRLEASKLFAQKGFQAVTMTDICEKTGMSRGGLYRYYSGTGEIFSEILSEEPSIFDSMAREERPAVVLEELLEAMKREILDREHSLSLAIYEYASLGNGEFFAQWNQKAKGKWAHFISRGIEAGEFAAMDPGQAAELILYYYQGLRM